MEHSSSQASDGGGGPSRSHDAEPESPPLRSSPQASLLRGLRAWERAPLGARWPAVVAWMVSIWLLSSRHGGGGVRFWGTAVLWNGGHFVVFGILAVLWRSVLAGRRIESVRADLGAWLITVGYAVVDELHQAEVPGRSSDPWDVGSDASGAAFALSIAVLLRGQLSGRRPAPARWVAGIGLVSGMVSVAMATWS